MFLHLLLFCFISCQQFLDLRNKTNCISFLRCPRSSPLLTDVCFNDQDNYHQHLFNNSTHEKKKENSNVRLCNTVLLCLIFVFPYFH